MGHCRSCKHWGNNIYENAQPQHWPGVPPGYRAKFCEVIAGEIGVYDTEVGTGKPGEQMNLPIATPPGFGCIQFEAK